MNTNPNMKTIVSNSNANPSLIIRTRHEDESELTKADTNMNPCKHDLIPLKYKSELKRQIRAKKKIQKVTFQIFTSAPLYT